MNARGRSASRGAGLFRWSRDRHAIVLRAGQTSAISSSARRRRSGRERHDAGHPGRQIDISIGSQFAICGVVAGLLAQEGLADAARGAGTVAAGAGDGALNGVLVARMGLPAIVVTLATMVACARGCDGRPKACGCRTCPRRSSGSASGRTGGERGRTGPAAVWAPLRVGARGGRRRVARSTRPGPMRRPRGSSASDRRRSSSRRSCSWAR